MIVCFRFWSFLQQHNLVAVDGEALHVVRKHAFDQVNSKIFGYFRNRVRNIRCRLTRSQNSPRNFLSNNARFNDVRLFPGDFFVAAFFLAHDGNRLVRDVAVDVRSQIDFDSLSFLEDVFILHLWAVVRHLFIHRNARRYRDAFLHFSTFDFLVVIFRALRFQVLITGDANVHDFLTRNDHLYHFRERSCLFFH